MNKLDLSLEEYDLIYTTLEESIDLPYSTDDETEKRVRRIEIILSKMDDTLYKR